MAGSTYFFHVFFAVLIIMSPPAAVIGVLGAPIACGIGSNKAPADEWNPDATTLADGATKLNNTVIQACKEKSFKMPDDALNLAKRNIPADFHKWNDRPRGCVQTELEINEIRKDTQGKETVANQWNIEFDADCKTDTQVPHYGYTVDATLQGRKIPRRKGHVCLVNNTPPNCRPWKSENKGGQLVHFSDEIKSKSAVFKLNGTSYNQFNNNIMKEDL